MWCVLEAFNEQNAYSIIYNIDFESMLFVYFRACFMFGMKIFFICEADGLQCHLVSRIIFVFYTYIIMAMRQKDFLTKFMKWFLKHFNVNVNACHKALKIYLIPSQTRESNASVFFKELDMLQFWAHFMVYLLKILCLVSDNIENNCLVDIYMCVWRKGSQQAHSIDSTLLCIHVHICMVATSTLCACWGLVLLQFENWAN